MLHKNGIDTLDVHYISCSRILFFYSEEHVGIDICKGNLGVTTHWLPVISCITNSLLHLLGALDFKVLALQILSHLLLETTF